MGYCDLWDGMGLDGMGRGGGTGWDESGRNGRQMDRYLVYLKENLENLSEEFLYSKGTIIKSE